MERLRDLSKLYIYFFSYLDEGRMHQFPDAKKSHGNGTCTYTDGHRDSMKESAKGRFFENIKASIFAI